MSSKIMGIASIAAGGCLVAAACAGCGSSASTSASSSNLAASKAYTLTFIPGDNGDPFYITMQCGIQAQAKAEGATVSVQGPAKFDATLQVPVLQSVVASKPDAILIAPDDASALQTPIEQARAAGIKVVLVDTTLENPSVAVSAVSSDNVAGGEEAFAAIKQLLPHGGQVLTVGVQPGVSTDVLRLQGFAQAIKADPAFKYLGVQYSKQSSALAAQIVEAELQKDPNISAIFASNLAGGEGAATGIRVAGKQGTVKLVEIDATPIQVQALEQGTVQALISQYPRQEGIDAVQQAIRALKGQPTTKSIATPFAIITKANLNASASQSAIYKDNC
jgi:ribose transport system substrate-binding protein